MAKSTHASPAAVTYARSLLELAQERNVAEPIGAELQGIKQVLDDNPSFREFLKDPGVGAEERTGVVDRVLRARVDPLLSNFLGVLGVKNRLGLLDQIAAAYDDLLDELLGKVEVDVTVATALSPAELEEVRQRVGAALKKDAVIRQFVDESIIGGLVLRVGDKLIDASVHSQLETMRRQFLAAAPR
jgi:F-type H+-transporting ATPase subunit delta